MPLPDHGAAARIRVRAIDGTADEAQWTRYVAEHPAASIYHSLAWRDLLRHSFGYRSWSLMATDEATGAVAGVVPVFLVSSPLGRRLVAVPFRDRGGLLWTDAAAFVPLVAAVKRIAAQAGASSIELKTVDPYPPELAADAGLEPDFYWIRSAVPLAGFADKPLWQQLGAKRRSPIRQAQEAGVAAEDSTDAGTWYDLHLQTQQRLGLPPFPLKFFRALLSALVPASAARLLVARRGGKALAATILLVHRRSVVYGYAASSLEGQQQAAGDFVLFSALEAAIAEGREVFDMGSDAPSQSGLLFFKKRWFAVQSPIPSYRIGGGARSDSSSARYRLLRQGFTRLPRSLLRLTSTATKYFG